MSQREYPNMYDVMQVVVKMGAHNAEQDKSIHTHIPALENALEMLQRYCDEYSLCYAGIIQDAMRKWAGNRPVGMQLLLFK